jgi:hypothetical protein
VLQEQVGRHLDVPHEPAVERLLAGVRAERLEPQLPVRLPQLGLPREQRGPARSSSGSPGGMRSTATCARMNSPRAACPLSSSQSAYTSRTVSSSGWSQMALRKDCSSGLMRRVSRVLPYYNRVRAPRHRPL